MNSMFQRRKRGEGVERVVRIELRVRARPRVLIERLDDVVRLGDGLPQPKGEGDLAVREMAEDVADAPLPRRRRAREPRGVAVANEPGDGDRESSRARRAGGVAEELGVGVELCGGADIS